jgi:hypothetical protein
LDEKLVLLFRLELEIVGQDQLSWRREAHAIECSVGLIRVDQEVGVIPVLEVANIELDAPVGVVVDLLTVAEGQVGAGFRMRIDWPNKERNNR